MRSSPTFKSNPYFIRRTIYSDAARAAAAAQAGPWSVPSLCAAYNWPTGLAGGGVIAIVELGGGWVQSDMDQYFQSINQPSPSITDVSVDGTQNSPNQSVGAQDDPDYEVALDIQVAAAAYYTATGQPATIRVYWSQDIASAVQKATADSCDVCSISWGADEANWGPAAAEAMEAAAQAATAAGTVVFAAAGDNDSSDGGNTPANVDVPSSCPHVVACGGTYKTSTIETVWNDNPGQTDGEGTGGGYSTIFPVQAWQIGAPPAPANTQYGSGRMVPDVCADADPNTGYEIVVHGAATSVGGTSAVAPLYAGLFASFGTKLGFVTPTLWQNQGDFNDITQGNNGFYSAAVGPDPCSGIGSPNAGLISQLFVNVNTSSAVHA
jgi:kumamolisin